MEHAEADLASIEARVTEIRRPDQKLLNYYALTSLLWGPLFPFIFVPRFFRYRTLRYNFDRQGVSMRWGILFRREVNLTYSRIQDIHLRSGVFERHLGLARLEVQTASGSAKAEMTIEGLLEFEDVRDYLYARMRGGVDPPAEPSPRGSAVAASTGEPDHLAGLLREITTEIRALRAALASRPDDRHDGKPR